MSEVSSDMSFAEQLEAHFKRCRDMEAPFNERLSAFADAVRAMSPSFAEAVDRLVRRLTDMGAGVAAPEPGEPMPPFFLPDENGALVSLDDILTRGPAVVVFHRGHWCPYCRISASVLAEAHKEFAAAGGQVVAITPDKQPFTRTLKEEARAPFPFLTDLDNGYALSLNLAIWVGEEMEKMIGDAGWALPRYQGSPGWMLPVPATFVVGQDGIVKARFVDPDYRRRMAVEDILKALRADLSAAAATSPRSAGD